MFRARLSTHRESLPKILDMHSCLALCKDSKLTYLFIVRLFRAAAILRTCYTNEDVDNLLVESTDAMVQTEINEMLSQGHFFYMPNLSTLF